MKDLPHSHISILLILVRLVFKQKQNKRPHFFSKTLINKYVHNTTEGKIYACFFDFKKAYDSVWQEGLLRKHECKKT